MTQEEKAQLERMSENTLLQSLGIEILSIEEGRISGRMPVDKRTHQPYGLLHGGASAALVETLGSIGSHFLIDQKQQLAVGIEVNTNHLKGVRSGSVVGEASILHRGRKSHVWNVDIKNENGELTATGRLTVMVVDIK
ncbi:PaaI family thioesterase [Halocola ammonii]